MFENDWFTEDRPGQKTPIHSAHTNSICCLVENQTLSIHSPDQSGDSEVQESSTSIL